MCYVNNDKIMQINLEDNVISNEKTVELLGILVDNKLLFEPHLSKTSKNFQKNSTYISQKKVKMIMRVVATP